ncbi:hypothetical protein [Anabaena sp. FACHB-1391]|uniref:hypothetical protein n=1 Tax=Anabaena sp. FACHB-1391 TaxID=2692771 RepID=UPI00168056BF|nr:hypothetical protein [Anabaena sp. FACHB-1391]
MTGKREQGRGKREQGTGNREQGTGNREQVTGDREQGTGNREEGTGNREEGIGKREQGRGNREQVFSDFTFLYRVWFFDANLLILVIFLINNLMKKNVEMFHGTSLQGF